MPARTGTRCVGRSGRSSGIRVSVAGEPGRCSDGGSRSVESGSESTWNGARPRASIHASENPASLEVAASAPNATSRRCASGGAQPPACPPSRTFRRLLQVSLHFVPPHQAREVRGLDGGQYLRGAVSMRARASFALARIPPAARPRRSARSDHRDRRARRPRTVPRSVPVCRRCPQRRQTRASRWLGSTRRWSMPVLVFAESRGIRVAIGPVVEPLRQRGGGPSGGRWRDDSTGSSEALTCARSRVKT